MAFVRPSLTEIVTRVEADFVSRLGLNGAPLRRSMVRILARVIAGAVHMLYGLLVYLSVQIFPDRSDAEFFLRQLSLFGLSLLPPTYARATASISGTNGSIVPAGTLLNRPDGAEYATDADVTVSAGVGVIAVTAVVAGALQTLSNGSALSFESPVAGVDATATVIASTQDGSDQETIDAARVRLLERMANPPHGGNTADYVEWSKEASSGVTRVWVYPLGLGPGTVLIRFARDNDVGGPIPDSGEVTQVQDYLDVVAPVTATVTVAAPVAAPVAFTVHVVPNTVAVQNAVTAELADLLLRDGAPGDTLLLSAIRTAIGTADGLTDYTLSVPAADVALAPNQLPTLGTVSFI